MSTATFIASMSSEYWSSKEDRALGVVMEWKERKPLMMMMRPPGRTGNSAASARPRPSIPRYTGFFRDGMRGVTGSGSTYGGIIFAISISLELDEPASLRVILVLSSLLLEIARNGSAVSTVEGRTKCVWVGSRRYKREIRADLDPGCGLCLMLQ